MNVHLTTLLAFSIAVMPGPLVRGQEDQAKSDATMLGDWEGAFVAEGSKTQGIIWRFTLSDSGALVGFMGPVEAGPVLPMADLIVTGTELRFALEGQGSYVGTISTAGISGTWTDGEGPDAESAQLNMTKNAPQEKTPRDFRGSDRTWLGTEEGRTSCVATGDLDGDGDLDVVIGNGRHWTEANEVFFNNGRGRYTHSNLLDDRRAPTYMVITVDIDGDQDLDILVGNESLENVVYLNDGKGSFTLGSTFGGTEEGVRDLVAIDLNGDGSPDIVELTRGGANTLYINDGKGHLRKDGTIGAGRDSIGAAAAGDLNGDHLVDLVLVDRDRGRNTIYMRAEVGFEEPITFGRAGDETHDVAIADMNGDGWMDIITVSIGKPNQIHFGDSTQTFGDTAEFGDGARSYAVAVGDLDNDGDIDIVVGNQRGKNAAYFNDDEGRAFQRLIFGPVSHTYDIAVGDLNGDGFLDVVTANSNGVNQCFFNVAPRR